MFFLLGGCVDLAVHQLPDSKMASMQRLQQQQVSGRAGSHHSVPFVVSQRAQRRSCSLTVLKAQNRDVVSNCQQDQKIGSSIEQPQPSWEAHPAFVTACSLLLLAGPAQAADGLVDNNPFAGIQSNSLYVTLALFLMSVPGIWSQIKRAPQANKKRKTFEVDGPKRANAMSTKDRARQIVTYFKKYNYEIKEMGEVITFAGLYAADKGQAAAVTFYTFVGMASVALVLSILVPSVGNWWYGLTLAAPAAWFYYFQKGERVEEVKVKMVTADNEETVDIIIEGDIEEITRFAKELDLVEKGMVRVKGILEGV